jgi:hypothetical protein
LWLAVAVAVEVSQVVVELAAYLLHLQPFLLVRRTPLRWALLELLVLMLVITALVEQIP